MTERNDDILVTVATHLDPMEAAIVQSCLQGEDIEAYVVDDKVAGTAWYLASVSGGAKVQVRSSDAERAMDVLARRAESIESAGEDTEADALDIDYGDDEDDSDGGDDEPASEPAPSCRALLDRAMRMAMCGFVFPPLQVYSLWVLLCAYWWRCGEPFWKKCFLILLLNSPTIGLLILPVFLW